MTDFDEKHDEHLVLLQQRNRWAACLREGRGCARRPSPGTARVFGSRILKALERKDPLQLRLKQLEQGFTLYVNGANSEASRGRKISPPALLGSGGARTPRANREFLAGRDHPEAQGRNSPSDQRRLWLRFLGLGFFERKKQKFYSVNNTFDS